jgi:hypothetical protein
MLAHDPGRQSTAHLQPLTPWPGVSSFNFITNEQEAHVEEFRRMLEAKGAWRKEDHGKIQDQLWQHKGWQHGQASGISVT